MLRVVSAVFAVFVAFAVEPHEHVDRQSDRRDEAQDDHDRGQVHPDQDQENGTADQLPQNAVDRGIDLLGLSLVICHFFTPFHILNLLSSVVPKISNILAY